MAKNTGVDIVIGAVSEHAESVEIMKRDQAQNTEQAQRDKEEAIANIYELSGKIKATNFFKTQAEFFNLLLLKKVKDSKEYRERLGMTWEQFCTHAGLNWRTIDRNLEDLKPFHYDFLQTFVNFSGVTFSKIKYLGVTESVTVTENAITYNGETIPVDVEHADEIQSLLETLEENHKKEKDEAAETIKTKERLLRDKDKVMDKQARDIARLERTVPKSELTEEEQDAVNLLMQAQRDVMTVLLDVKKKIKPHEAPEIALRQYYYLLILVAKIAMEDRMILHEAYEAAEDVPWEITDMEMPSQEVMMDNLPLSAGHGMGEKIAAKKEERKAKSGKK